ncbi:hypothetical protein [Arthrobacter sp. RCC_34]|uniref:hypothetical protein n=1 Tax=Arthrobacter sp. RCC_34 TaxID=3239230 RepID=UPI0035243EF0
MTALDLDRLEALADAATPGKWMARADELTWMLEPDDEFGCGYCEDGAPLIIVKEFGSDSGRSFTMHYHQGATHHVEVDGSDNPITGNYDYEEGGILETADAVFIAETGPDVVKELVRQLREARAGQADAWVEGFDAGHRAARSLTHRDNPYRSGDE